MSDWELETPRAYPSEEVCRKTVDCVICQLDGFLIVFEFE